MRWFFYHLLFAVGYLLLVPHFLFRMFRRGGYRARFADRFGFYPAPVRERLRTLAGRAIWIHAVSVGEVYVAGQMMRALRQLDPSLSFVLSTTSSTGWKEAERQVGPGDVLIYHPLDFLPCVRRALRQIAPRALVLTESEIWPTVIRSCAAHRIPLFLINARVSDRSAPRYRALRYWFAPVLQSFTRIFAQSQMDRDRLVAAGAAPDRVIVTGSFKFDVAHRAPEVERSVETFLRMSGMPANALVLLGGSTWPGEDAALLRVYSALRQVSPSLRLVMVPRHFEKADAVQETIEKAGFVCIRKSRVSGELPDVVREKALRGEAVWLADTTGELMGFYGNAHIVFVGKSLCEHGAQNMIEPCLCGAAVLVGPYTENFRPVMADLLDANALIQVKDEDDLRLSIGRLLASPAEREALGTRAAASVARRCGVVSSCARELLDAVKHRAWESTGGDVKVSPPPLSLWIAFVCLAQLFLGGWVSALFRTADLFAGNIALGLASCVLSVFASLFLGIAVAEVAWRRVRLPARFLPFLFLALSLFAACLLGRLDVISQGWQRLLVDGTRGPSLLYGLLFTTACAFYLVPSFCSGMMAYMLERSFFEPRARNTSRSLSLFFAVSVFPFVLGLWAGGAYWLPIAGISPFIRVFVLLFCLLAVVSIFTTWQHRLRFRNVCVLFLVLCSAVGVLAFTRSRRIHAPLLSMGSFSRLVFRDTGFATGKPLSEYLLRDHEVSLFWDRDYQFVFTLDGRPLLFGNRFHAPRTLTAYLPFLFRPLARRVGVFGDEAGFYLPFFSRAGVEEFRCGEADPRVVRMAMAADSFLTGTKDQDVREPLFCKGLSPSDGYDFLLLAYAPVWTRGTAWKYSESHLRRCKNALTEDGLLALHLDTRALSTARFAALARAFLSVFPHAQFWCVGRYDWVFLGGSHPLQASASQMLEFFEKQEVNRDFVRAGILSLPEIFPSLLTDEVGMASWAERSPTESPWQTAMGIASLLLSDDRGARLSLNQVEGLRQRKMAWFLPDQLDTDLYMAIRDKTDEFMNARHLSSLALSTLESNGSEEGVRALVSATKMNPRDQLVRYFLASLELEGRRRIQLSEYQGALKCYEKLLSFRPDSGVGHYGIGYCLRATGDVKSAFDHFARAVHAVPEQIDYRMELAQVASSLGDYEEAERQYQTVLKQDPSHPEALFRYAKSLASKTRPTQNYSEAIRLAVRACESTHWRVSEYAYGLAEMYLDAGRVMEGMGLKRRLKEQGLRR